MLFAAEGKENKRIAAVLRVMPRIVASWRGRFSEGGLAASNVISATHRKQIRSSDELVSDITSFQLGDGRSVVPGEEPAVSSPFCALVLGDVIREGIGSRLL